MASRSGYIPQCYIDKHLVLHELYDNHSTLEGDDGRGGAAWVGL